jgi:dipeptidyl aminopeptidase/acylaminoacyl peptidase
MLCIHETSVFIDGRSNKGAAFAERLIHGVDAFARSFEDDFADLAVNEEPLSWLARRKGEITVTSSRTRTILGRFTLVSAFVAHLGTAADEKPHAVTAEEIVDLRGVADVRLSPDGARVAFVVTEPADPKQPKEPRRSSVWIVSTDGKTPARALTNEPRTASSPRWSADGRIAFLSDRGPDGTSQVYLLSLEGARQPDKLTSAKTGVDDFEWSPDGRRLAFTTRDPLTPEEEKRQAEGDDAIEVDRGLEYTRLWIVDVAKKASTLITRHDAEVEEFAWSPDGDEIALVVAPAPGPEAGGSLSLQIVEANSGTVRRRVDARVSFPGALRWSPDGKWLTFFECSPGRPFGTWLSVVAARGEGKPHPLLGDEALSVLRVEWMPDSAAVMVQTMEATGQHISTVDVVKGTRQKSLAVTGSQWNFGFSTNGRTTAYLSESATSPADVWAAVDGGEGRRLTSLNPQTASWQLGTVSTVEWKNSEDGLIRRGVLVRPPGFRADRRYPMIVNCHPGDTAWWTGWQGTWWAWGQLLASHGYVVFLPNTRGVTGEGWRLHEAIGDWGGMSFQDLMDGVDALVARGTADPDRLGIGGFSNGGFMTEWAITHTRRFKAAVAEAGHSDFFSLYGTSYMRASLLVTFVKSPYEDRTVYDAHSPITFVRNCRTPTLVLHGALDRGVPVTQGYEFSTALKALGVETEMVVYPREGHGIRERAHQIDIQRRVVAWFDRFLMPEVR